ARFFRMKLDAGDLSTLNDRRKDFAVFRRRHRVFGDRRDVAVREIHLGARLDAIDDRACAVRVDAVPADVRHFDVTLGGRWSQPPARAGEIAESGKVRCFLARLIEPLHALTDPELRSSAYDVSFYHLDH